MKEPISSAQGPVSSGEGDGLRAPGAGVDASGVVGSGGGDRAELLAGRITRDEFLDRQVARALEPLVGRIAPDKLSHMREILTLELGQDPVLVRLVTQAASLA
jgi:hypothetical protein